MGESKPLILRYVRVADLVPYARNARKHPESQIVKLMGIIRRFGFRNPILVADDTPIIAGHGRVIAAGRLGMVEVPSIDCSDLSPEEIKALRLADNRIAEDSEWDDDLLAAELAELAQRPARAPAPAERARRAVCASYSRRRPLRPLPKPGAAANRTSGRG